jgi:hypothetical protein
MAPMSIIQYTIDSDLLHEIELSGAGYKQVHAVRDLSENNFLIVYDRLKNNPRFNAVIQNTDSLILDRFSYEGIMEETDAIFLFHKDTINNRYFVHDASRNVLVIINTKDSISLKQIPESLMTNLPEDTIISEDFYAIDFEPFGSKIFYISASDSNVFYSKGME